MSSLSQKDRASLCSFTFSDGRRCRTPRFGQHPRFCFYHAQKESRALAAEKLGKDLAYFFSGDYLSACDLSTALARLIPAVVRGDVKPRAARTVAYLAQTLMQAIHISQHEYCEAFSSDAWRKSIRNSVKGNYNYRFPPAPESQHRESSAPATTTVANSPAPEPLQLASAAPSPHPQHTSPPPRSVEPPVNCHSERSDERPTGGASPESHREESASSSDSPLATHHSPLPQAPAPIAQPTNPSPTVPPIPKHPPTIPSRDAYAPHFDHGCRLLIDGKPF